MSIKDDVREFLVSRRGNVTPRQAGLPDGGGERRVPGLRREEVAALAGVSLEYYTRLERGNIGGASESVLRAISEALRLDDVERAHLLDLARRAGAPRARRPEPRTEPEVSTSVQRVLDSMAVPAVVVDPRQNIVAANLLGRAMHAPHLEADRPNFARFIFLDPRAQDFYVDWALARSVNAAMLRRAAGRDPLDAELTALVGELSTRSPRFREDWARQDVHEHRTGRKVYRHPEVGELDVTYDVFELPGSPGLSVTSYTAEPGSPTAERFALLASLAASRTDRHRPGQPRPGVTATE
ncbi:helix-turn-helix transcriptional regulator [Isoptericola haloaureus]|uniref:Helix-turn-helix transcriptional regulator n=1 Tax=Isoptericola haloaureus TaxID=1542902 RepID=A0ABU7Z793_9MICO